MLLNKKVFISQLVETYQSTYPTLNKTVIQDMIDKKLLLTVSNNSGDEEADDYILHNPALFERKYNSYLKLKDYVTAHELQSILESRDSRFAAFRGQENIYNILAEQGFFNNDNSSFPKIIPLDDDIESVIALLEVSKSE